VHTRDGLRAVTCEVAENIRRGTSRAFRFRSQYTSKIARNIKDLSSVSRLTASEHVMLTGLTETLRNAKTWDALVCQGLEVLLSPGVLQTWKLSTDDSVDCLFTWLQLMKNAELPAGSAALYFWHQEHRVLRGKIRVDSHELHELEEAAHCSDLQALTMCPLSADRLPATLRCRIVPGILHTALVENKVNLTDALIEPIRWICCPG